jgi:hypothetical protein
MAQMRCLLLVAASALLAACTAANEPLESSRGTAVRIVDDMDALEAAMEEAEDHCDRYDRHPVLQSVSPVDRDELLATFDCVESSRGGVALFVGDDDEDVRRASREAEDYCDEADRVAVLQSVGEIDDRRVAAFNCVRT